MIRPGRQINFNQVVPENGVIDLENSHDELDDLGFDPNGTATQLMNTQRFGNDLTRRDTTF